MRFHFILLFLLLGLRLTDGAPSTAPAPKPAATPAAAPTSAPAPSAPPRATAVSAADLKAPDADVPVAVPGGVNVHWYGHGFVYLTSSVGIRAAIDPFSPDAVHYKFPTHLASDFVLVTHEAEDHCAANLIFGNPLIFRSVMAVGLQRANGIPFYGTALQRDSSGRGVANTAFVLTFDGVTFGYLGQINQPLLAREKTQLGKVDVLFLPVGLTTLSVGELNQAAQDMGAKIIIPINYKTEQSGIISLRTLDDYLDATKLPVRKFNSDELIVTKKTLPDEPTLYVLKSP